MGEAAQRCIYPGGGSAVLVWRMEDLPVPYEEPYRPREKPTVRFDDASGPASLGGPEARAPLSTYLSISARPGRAERYDHEHERGGATNLPPSLAFFEKKRGRFSGHPEVGEHPAHEAEQDLAL